MKLTTEIIGYLLVAMFLVSGVMKLVGAQPMRKSAAHLALSFEVFRIVGVLEVAGAAGLVIGNWIPVLRIAAAAGLAGLMAGAVRYHLRAKDPVGQVFPAALCGVLALAVAVQAGLAL